MIKEIKFGVMPTLNYACQEAVNELCTNIKFSGTEKKVIMFTSVQASEGKSFVAMSAAITFAKLGCRTAFIDCDLRRSEIKGRYKITADEPNFVGLAHYLAGMNPLEEVIYAVRNVPRLNMIPVGKLLANSLPMVSTKRFQSMMEKLKSVYDIIVVDAPPVGLIVDAAQIACSCDGVVLVVKYNTLSARKLADIKSQIVRTGCDILGVVINGVSFDSLASKHYYNKYSYHYPYDSLEKRRRSQKKK